MTGLDGVKAATWGLHRQAERSGIIADILAGQATCLGVALLLRNLLPVYQILDHSAFGHPALVRSAAIEADLQLLAPKEELPLLAEGAAYVLQVRKAAEGDAARLAAHAYVRYLGDLNGGLIMLRRLRVCFGETAQRMTFHAYSKLEDKDAFTRAYREKLDRAVRAADFAAIAGETSAAFEMNILLSNAVKQCVAPREEASSPEAATSGISPSG